jgi:hypothetical protein
MIIKKKHSIIAFTFLFLLIGYYSYQYFFKPHPQKIDEHYLLRTKWSQQEYYSKFAPDSSYIGCWAVALSQILYYHKYLPQDSISYKTESGFKVKEIFDNYTFDFDIFQDVLNNESKNESINQVARYLYFSSLVLKKNWFGDSYLDKNEFPSRMKKHYNCKITEFEYGESEFVRLVNDIKNIIMEEIDSKRPVLYYFDNGGSFGHTCVIDGYFIQNSHFLIHLNLGWGGYQDGWYNLENRFIRSINDKHYRLFITIKPNNIKVGKINDDEYCGL